MDFSWISNPEIWISLGTLTALEIVLGIDNIVVITILTGKLPVHQQRKARMIGLGVAMGARILLLLSITWIMGLTQPLFSILGLEISGKDIVLIVGGLFLLAKATHEIHNRLEGEEEGNPNVGKGDVVFASVIAQILLMDIVFSLDSVITAVGMANEIWVMIAAVVIAVGVMMVSVNTISDFVHRHPTIKMLALSFLLLIGVMLIVEGLHAHIPKGYIYFAMAFSILVEALNLRSQRNRKKKDPVQLRNPQITNAVEHATRHTS